MTTLDVNDVRAQFEAVREDKPFRIVERMHTRRAQVDRILKAKGNVTIETLQHAASPSEASHGSDPPDE